MYESHKDDVSHKRDFTKYPEHTNSLIFNEITQEKEIELVKNKWKD